MSAPVYHTCTADDNLHYADASFPQLAQLTHHLSTYTVPRVPFNVLFIQSLLYSNAHRHSLTKFIEYAFCNGECVFSSN